MPREFAIDLIEQKKELLYVVGLALSTFSLSEQFLQVNEYRKKNKQKRAILELVVEAIIVDGEPVDRLEAQSAAMLALSGDWQAIIDCAKALNWQAKGGRFLRTSDIILSLSDE
jgi:GH35 family endo-1,4-beta-xylanase